MILESAFSHEPHEYLRDTLDSKYRECNSCFNRTEFTCVKCGFCWSCHRKMEQAEKFELFDRSIGIDILAPSFSSYSRLMAVKEKGKKKEQHLSKEIGNYQITTKAIDVFGKEVEPICDYDDVIISFLYMVLVLPSVGVNILKIMRLEHN